MMIEPIRVSSSWLDRREAADSRARASEFVSLLRQRSPAEGRWLIHDLACGNGSMGRWLAPLLPGPQHWVLHDRDADLLALAVAKPPGPAADGAEVVVETRLGNVTQLRPDDFAGATLITASALLDLLTWGELTRLVQACAGAACPVLFTLSVSGRVDLLPADPLDARIATAFNAHQRGPTPRGRLLGPDAVQAAVDGFRSFGGQVIPRPSPWQLGATDTDLAIEWLNGWVDAACQQQPELGPQGDLYRRRRLQEAAAKALVVTVGHTDLLVLP
jgi:hypothetical protein